MIGKIITVKIQVGTETMSLQSDISIDISK